jgi:4-amino-4-deoxy-L-arabinose transferase-like glycosyltransferase
MNKIIKFILENKWILLILLLSIFLRFWKITSIPPSLNWDEISHGYNAYSILKTGKDEWGSFLPIIFKAYGDYKLPVYIYLTVLSEAVLGLTSLAVRLVSVLAGVSTVIFTYLLTKKIFDKRVALLATFLVAIEPWSLFLSRGAFEANLALTLIVSGIYFLLRSLDDSRFCPLTLLLLGLSVWTYNSARIFVPLLLLAFIIIYRNSLKDYLKNKKALISSSWLLLLFFVPMFYQLLSPSGQARYGKVAILDEGAIAQINEKRNSSELNPILTRLIYNKVTYFSLSFTRNWFSHFSLNFLFLKGGTNYQFSLPNHGTLYLIDLPFLFLGTYLLLRTKKKEGYLLLSWFVLAPVASSLTREAPHVLRDITFLPLPMVLTSLGFISTHEWLKGRKKLSFLSVPLITVCLIITTALAGNYLYKYFKEYPVKYSWSWQFGYKETVDYLKSNHDSYDKIIMTKKYGEPHAFILFNWPWDPEKYQNDQGKISFYQSEWYWIDKFDKFYFVNDWQIPKEGEILVMESKEKIDCNKIKCLLITSPGNYPKGWLEVGKINFLNGETAFEILKN